MAVLQEVTSSNTPRVDTELAAEVLDEWGFVGNHGELTVDVDEGCLSVHGYCGFNPYRVADVDDLDDKYAESDPEAFLSALALALEEPLVVQRIAHEKTRFPLGAAQWIATPAGDVTVETFQTLSQEVPDP
jgi:hypothetical protein